MIVFTEGGKSLERITYTFSEKSKKSTKKIKKSVKNYQENQKSTKKKKINKKKTFLRNQKIKKITYGFF